MAKQDARTNALVDKVLWVHGGGVLIAVVGAIITGIIKTVF